tara:strand:+ start:1375 stop:1596 length:222 start_codon:yes stop_codon:yes gene_type:complete
MSNEANISGLHDPKDRSKVLHWTFGPECRDLIIAAIAAVQAIDSGESAIGKMYLEAALLQIDKALDDDPEALE